MHRLLEIEDHDYYNFEIIPEISFSFLDYKRRRGYKEIKEKIQRGENGSFGSLSSFLTSLLFSPLSFLSSHSAFLLLRRPGRSLPLWLPLCLLFFLWSGVCPSVLVFRSLFSFGAPQPIIGAQGGRCEGSSIALPDKASIIVGWSSRRNRTKCSVVAGWASSHYRMGSGWAVV